MFRRAFSNICRVTLPTKRFGVREARPFRQQSHHEVVGDVEMASVQNLQRYFEPTTC